MGLEGTRVLELHSSDECLQEAIDEVRVCNEKGCITILSRYNFGPKCWTHEPPPYVQCLTDGCVGEAKKRGRCDLCNKDIAEQNRRRIAEVPATDFAPKCSRCNRVLAHPDDAICKVCELIEGAEQARVAAGIAVL